MSTASYAAWLFHETYERLAPGFGYEVRPDVGCRPFSDLPENNRRLMIATAQQVTDALRLDELTEVAQHATALCERFGCRHAYDPACPRCETFTPLRIALAVLDKADCPSPPQQGD